MTKSITSAMFGILKNKVNMIFTNPLYRNGKMTAER
jgi:hypothetical protein